MSVPATTTDEDVTDGARRSLYRWIQMVLRTNTRRWTHYQPRPLFVAQRQQFRVLGGNLDFGNGLREEAIDFNLFGSHMRHTVKVWLDKNTEGICMAISIKGSQLQKYMIGDCENILPLQESSLAQRHNLREITIFLKIGDQLLARVRRSSLQIQVLIVAIWYYSLKSAKEYLKEKNKLVSLMDYGIPNTADPSFNHQRHQLLMFCFRN